MEKSSEGQRSDELAMFQQKVLSGNTQLHLHLGKVAFMKDR